MFDCVIVGGGVIGLSLAYELAGRGRRVCVLDRDVPGRSASWAGAGMLPPASSRSTDPLDQFAHFSGQLHEEWAQRLQDETGIDTGYRKTGAIYLASTEASVAELRSTAARAKEQGITFDELTEREIERLEPALRIGSFCVAYHVPGECQIRNPRHLRALLLACTQRGVTMVPHAAAENFEIRAGKIESVRTSQDVYRAEQFCITTGAWTGALLTQLGLSLAIKPIRGQIALLRLPQSPLNHILNEGPLYLVPREDGRVLVGSTMEDVGFDTSTTPAAIEELTRFAHSLVPALAEATLETSWAGLRPASADGQAYLGQLPNLTNAYLAAGHTRSGLHFSAATAMVLARLMTGEPPGLNLTPFRLDR